MYTRPLLPEGTHHVRLGPISLAPAPTKYDDVYSVEIEFHLNGLRQHKSILGSKATIQKLMVTWIEGNWAYARVHHVDHDGHTWAKFEIVG